MKKKLYSLIILVGILLPMLTACEDGKDDYLSDYSTILYFRNSGEIDLTLYKTGETTNYTLIVDKAGSNLKATANVDVSVMSYDQLETYNTSEGTNYQLIPSDCFSMAASSLQFSASDLYKTINVTISPEEVESYINGSSDYVIPFELTNASDSVNADKKYVFLRMLDVLTPSIGFENSGYVTTDDITGTSGTVTIQQYITMEIDNLWDFDYTVEVDTTVLNEYNTENDENLSLVASEACTIEAGPFVTGVNYALLTITIDKSKLSWGRQALPLRITSVSNSSFKVDEERDTCIIGINFTVPRSELTQITPATGLTWTSYGIIDWDGIGVPGLFDGDLTTYCHGDYYYGENDPVYGQYIDFHFPSDISHFAYDFWTRSSNANGAPVVTDLYVSNDGTNWTKLASVQTSFTSGGEEYDSGVYSSGTPYTYLRFAVVESNAGNCRTGSYWNGAEMKIYVK